MELAREGVSLNVIQRQLGHANLGTTSIYLEGIDIEEIIPHRARRPSTNDVRDDRPSALNDPDAHSASADPGARACGAKRRLPLI